MASWIKGNKYLSQSEMENNAKIIYTYLKNKGWTLNAISGMLGNMQVESSINPAIWQGLIEGSGGGGGYGLVQWTPWTNFTDWADDNGYAWDDGDAQLKWIDEVTTSFGQWIATSSYNFSFAAFKTSTQTPEYLASAFLKNFERAGVEKEETRKTNARNWYNYLTENGGAEPEQDANAKIIDSAVKWAVGIANDDSYGYTQDLSGRWGTLGYDCSSLLIQAYEQAGCPVKTNGALNTVSMETVFPQCGFEKSSFTSESDLKYGDVLLRDGHTAMYIGNGQIVSAHIDENGNTIGGQVGDQTGHEIDVSSFSSSGSWTWVLRLPSNGTTPSPDTPSNPETPSGEFNKLSKLLLYAVGSEII